MHPIHVLWATPRSTSTAFEWMMRMRGDMACFHEPFGEAWYQGDEALAPRPVPAGQKKPGLTFGKVVGRLKAAALKRPVFLKDMPQFTDHLWSDGFLGQFRHAFLIRDPAKVLASLQRSWDKSGNTEGFTRKEIGFEEQRRLFDLLSDKQGQPPPVIDSDDLLSDPHGMVAAYCTAIEIPFLPEALSWKPGDRSDVLWYDSNDSIWHETLKNSDGLKPQPGKPANVGALPKRLQDLHSDFLPHYRHMHRQRLTA